ncbi:MAG: hypothetical protein ACK4WD_06585 [Flavobacteriales bacterium]
MIRHLLIFGLFLLTNHLLGQSTILIQDAVHKEIIEYEMSGSWNQDDKQLFLDADGQYFGKCMTIDLKSKVDSAIWLYLVNGLMLMCEDTATQDMIITKPIYVKLEPKKSKTVQLYAMCSEIHDGIPHKLTKYKFGDMADNNLVAITNAINDMFMHNVVGQGAVWAYTDNATEEDIRKYGATDASIELTIQVLNRAGVSTQLNPTSQPTADTNTTIIQADIVPAVTSNKNIISLDAYIVYSAGGVLLILLGSTVFLLLRRRNTKQDKQTET